LPFGRFFLNSYEYYIKASLSNHLVIPVMGCVANDLEVGLFQSSHKVAVTYTSGATLPDFLTS